MDKFVYTLYTSLETIQRASLGNGFTFQNVGLRLEN